MPARTLEQALLAALLAAAVAGLVLTRDVTAPDALWPIALLAAAWTAHREPAWLDRVMALRGTGLVAVGALLAAAGASSPIPWLDWPSVVGLAYLVVVSSAIAVPLGVSLLALHAGLLAASGAAAQAVVIGTGALAMLVLLAHLAGRLLRAAWAARESGLFDSASGLCTGKGLAQFADEWPRRWRGGVTASLVVLDCPDLLEARRIYGSRAARKLLTQLVGHLEAVAGDHGLVARSGASEFAVLLPGCNADQAAARVHLALGSPMVIEYQWDDSEIMLVPEFAVGSITEEEDDVHALLLRLSRQLGHAREREERRQRYLRRSRERHTQPSHSQPGVVVSEPGALEAAPEIVVVA